MPLLFVHGVNTRRGDTLEEAIRPQSEYPWLHSTITVSTRPQWQFEPYHWSVAHTSRDMRAMYHLRSTPVRLHHFVGALLKVSDGRLLKRRTLHLLIGSIPSSINRQHSVALVRTSATPSVVTDSSPSSCAMPRSVNR
jgi:hypothetical protein